MDRNQGPRKNGRPLARGGWRRGRYVRRDGAGEGMTGRVHVVSDVAFD